MTETLKGLRELLEAFPVTRVLREMESDGLKQCAASVPIALIHRLRDLLAAPEGAGAPLRDRLRTWFEHRAEAEQQSAAMYLAGAKERTGTEQEVYEGYAACATVRAHELRKLYSDLDFHLFATGGAEPPDCDCNAALHLEPQHRSACATNRSVATTVAHEPNGGVEPPGASPSMKGQVSEMTLEQYLREELAAGKIDFHIRATLGQKRSGPDHVEFYIHPQSHDGLTLDFEVCGNTLTLKGGSDRPELAPPCDEHEPPDGTHDAGAFPWVSPGPGPEIVAQKAHCASLEGSQNPADTDVAEGSNTAETSPADAFRSWLVRQVVTCERRAKDAATKKSCEHYTNMKWMLRGILAEYDRRAGDGCAR